MHIAKLGIFVATLACGMVHANAQVSRGYWVVASGHPLEVAAISSLYPDCTTMGRTEINLLEAPHGGEVQVGEGTRYPGYVTANARSACNKRKVPATMVTYRSMPGFVGQDSFVIEKIFPYGVAQRQRFTVNVR